MFRSLPLAHRRYLSLIHISKSEMGYTFSLEFIVSPKDMGKVYNIMNSMDYEQQVNRTNHGRLYFRVPGIRVIFYDEIPLGNEILYKHQMCIRDRYYSDYNSSAEWMSESESDLLYKSHLQPGDQNSLLPSLPSDG